MKRFLLLTRTAGLLLVLTALRSNAQPVQSNSPVHKQYVNYGFQRSGDESKIALYNINKNNLCDLIILSLTDHSYQRLPAVACGALMDPSLTSMFLSVGGYVPNKDSTKAYFTTYWSPSGGQEKIQKFEGQYYTFGATQEGYLICGDASVSQGSTLISLKNLRVVNPATGAVIKTLYAGTLLEVAEGALAPPYGKSYNWMLNTAQTYLVRQDRANSDNKMIFPLNGKPAYKLNLHAFWHTLTDTIAIGGSYSAATKSGRFTMHNLITGRLLVDTSYTGGTLFRSVSYRGNRVYALPHGEKAIWELTPRNGRLHKVKDYPIDLDGKTLPEGQNYSLVVSTAASRIALIPDFNPSGRTLGNEALVWDMASGALLHQITAFYGEHAPAPSIASTPQLTDCDRLIQTLPIKPGMYVQKKGESTLFKVVGYDCTNMRYKTQYQYTTNTAVSSTPKEFNKLEMEGNQYNVVRVGNCNKCSGRGLSTKAVGYEKVEYGIYNKYTTTGSYNRTDVCENCDGLGVVKY